MDRRKRVFSSTHRGEKKKHMIYNIYIYISPSPRPLSKEKRKKKKSRTGSPDGNKLPLLPQSMGDLTPRAGGRGEREILQQCLLFFFGLCVCVHEEETHTFLACRRGVAPFGHSPPRRLVCTV